ncbi:MAG: glycosyltransferase family 9 protein [Deltaproteobacteria bacterium]|nr:glycosyltransferase family 9 protein [Deltaproteobacteria bacterium]
MPGRSRHMALRAPERVLVIRLSAIGDVVRTLPAVIALRRALPDAHLAWLVEEGAAEALAGHPDIDTLWIIPRRRWRDGLRSWRTAPATLRDMIAFARRLRAARFDWVVDFHGILKSGLWAMATGAPLRAGYEAGGNRGWGSREGNRLFTNRRAAVPMRRISRFDRNAILARFVWTELLGRDASTCPVAPGGSLLPVASSVQAEIDRWLEATAPEASGGDPPSGGYVAVHPGSSESTAYKRWFPERYGDVADALIERGFRVIFTWGPGEKASVESIVSAMMHPALIAPETPSLQHLGAIFRRCRLLIGNDTGPMHIAALSGTPVVAVFGPTDAIENAPYAGVPSIVVRKDVGCRCPKRRCLTRACFEAVDAKDVLDAALGILGEPSGAGLCSASRAAGERRTHE